MSHDPNSQAAARSIEHCAATMRAEVMAEICRAASTCDEVEIATGMPHQTASARIVELRRAGLIRRTGERRPTRSGRNAWVYVVALVNLPNPNREPMREDPQTQPQADADPAAGVPPQIAEVDTLRARITQLEDELRAHHAHRAAEQELVEERSAAIHRLEGAKNAVAACKSDIADIEARIAALITKGAGGVQTDLFAGSNVDAAKEADAAPWEQVLPKVLDDSVRILDPADPELPKMAAVSLALLADEVMRAEKRQIPVTVTAYGRAYIVTDIWKNDAGAMRANVVPLYSKDEWQQLAEEQFGRAVEGFDQSDEAKEHRTRGGRWCGLVVRTGRKVWVVGPQEHALHFVHQPAEPAEPIPGPGHANDPDASEGVVVVNDEEGQD